MDTVYGRESEDDGDKDAKATRKCRESRKANRLSRTPLFATRTLSQRTHLASRVTSVSQSTSLPIRALSSDSNPSTDLNSGAGSSSKDRKESMVGLQAWTGRFSLDRGPDTLHGKREPLRINYEHRNKLDKAPDKVHVKIDLKDKTLPQQSGVW